MKNTTKLLLLGLKRIIKNSRSDRSVQMKKDLPKMQKSGDNGSRYVKQSGGRVGGLQTQTTNRFFFVSLQQNKMEETPSHRSMMINLIILCKPEMKSLQSSWCHFFWRLTGFATCDHHNNTHDDFSSCCLLPLAFSQ